MTHPNVLKTSAPTPPAKLASPAQPILELLGQRWSPYSFSSQSLSLEDLKSLFEAARWAASSYNEQPWRYILATRQEEREFAAILECLVEKNQEWARHAAALAIGVVSTKLAKSGQPNAAATHDLGAASASLTLEATSRGILVHQMIGIVPERAREKFAIPADFVALTGLAMGYPGQAAGLDDEITKRDLAPRQRRPIEEFVFQGEWGRPALTKSL